MSTGSGCEPPTITLAEPLSVITETASLHESSWRYHTDEETGEYYIAVKDIVGSLLELAEALQGLGGLHEHIGDGFTQVAVQIATPFMEMDTPTKPGTLHILRGGSYENR